MAIWYMVKRLDTGEIGGHDTYFHGTLTNDVMRMRDEGIVEAWRHPDGTPHHLVACVEGKDEEDAMLMARVAFDLWHDRQQQEVAGGQG